MRLDSQHVVVLGGTSGMGEAIARLAVVEGARVTIAGRDPERLAAAKERLGSGVTGFTVDITDRRAVRGLFTKVGRLDHLAITAGDINDGTITDMDPDQLRSTMEVRFWGPMYAVKEALPQLASGGSITFTTGTAAIPRVPGSRAVSSSMIGTVVAAAEALALHLAAQLAPIRVNVIRPGGVATPRNLRRFGSIEKAEERYRQSAQTLPLKRIGQPDDIANAALFLMTAVYTTGIVVTADGGGYLL